MVRGWRPEDPRSRHDFSPTSARKSAAQFCLSVYPFRRAVLPLQLFFGAGESGERGERKEGREGRKKGKQNAHHQDRTGDLKVMNLAL